jgi:Na+/H+-dicarboxylate symporter
MIVATPLILFGLGMTLATQAGAKVGGALLGFTIIESIILVIALLSLYPVTVLLGGVTLRWFARAMGPAQLAAVSTRSSLATVPALLQAAETGPGSVPVFASYVLPLAGAMLKLSRAVTGPVKLLFLAHVLGIPLTAERVVIFAATVILISPATVGVPRVTPATRSLPAYVAAGIPAEYVLLLGAATAVTDVFQTVLNSTSYLSANVLVGRFASRREKEIVPEPVPVVRPLDGAPPKTSGGAAA